MSVDRLILVRSAATAAIRRAAFPADEPLDRGGHGWVLARVNWTAG
jgi:hypothetical protein